MSTGIYIIVLSTAIAGLSLEILLSRVAANVLGAAYPSQILTISLYLAGLSLGSLAARMSSLGRFSPSALSLTCLISAAVLEHINCPSLCFILFITSFLVGAGLTAWCPQDKEPNRLYVLANLGAALGAALTSLYLIANLGLSKSFLALSLLMIPAAILAIKRQAVAVEGEDANGKTIKAGGQVSLTLLFSSMVFLILECDYLRLAALILGSSHLAMAAVISTILLGLCGGNWLAIKYRIDDGGRAMAIFALSIALTLPLTAALPWLFLHLRLAFADLFWPSRLMAAAALTLPSSLAGGLIFPACTSNLRGKDWQKAYFVSSAGAVLAPFLFQFLLTAAPSPEHDILQALLQAAAVLAALYTVSLFCIRPRRQGSELPFMILPVVTILVTLLSPTLSRQELVAGLPWGPAQTPEQFGREKLLPLSFFKVGAVSTTAVEENQAGNIMYLKNDGKVEASIPINLQKPSVGSDFSTQTLLGVLPALMAQRAPDQRALIIGLGSGTTAGALLRAWPGKITVAELEPAVQEAATFFLFGAALAKAERQGQLNVVVEDGRNLLQPDTYQLIVSQPAEPRVTCSSALYSRQFFAKAAASLKEGGIMAQWLQLYGFSSQELAIALKTFHSAFSHMAVFHPPGGGELIVLGSNRPLNHQSLEEAFTGPERQLLARAGIGSYQILNGSFLLEGEALEQWLAKNASALPLNDDDNPVLEHGALRFKQTSDDSMLAQNLAMLPNSPQLAGADLNMCNEQIGKDPCAYSYLTSRASIYLLDGKIDKALADLRESIALYPDSPKSHELNAIALIFAGKLDLALEEAQAAHDLDRTSHIPYSLAAIAYRCQGNSQEARRTSNKARQICPDSEILKHIDEAIQTQSESASIGNPGILKSALVRLLNILE